MLHMCPILPMGGGGGRERERESQIHMCICYDLWVFATVTVANTHFSIYGYLLQKQILIEISMGICYP